MKKSAVPEDSALAVKKGHSNSPSADCKSKIGDMRGDFRAILSKNRFLTRRSGRQGCLQS